MTKIVAKQATMVNERLLKVADLLSQAAAELRRLAEGARRDPSQAWFWTDAWQEKERQADEDYRLGRYKSFNNVNDLITDLRKTAKIYDRANRQK